MNEPIIISDQTISYCDRTGLIYVDEVPFTKEMIAQLQSMFDYLEKEKSQFEFTFHIEVYDKATEKQVAIDLKTFRRMKAASDHYDNIVASNEDFK